MGGLLHPRHVFVVNVDLRFIADVVGHRPDQAQLRVFLQVPHKVEQPASRDIGVVVQYHEALARGRFQARLLPAAKPRFSSF